MEDIKYLDWCEEVYSELYRMFGSIECPITLEQMHELYTSLATPSQAAEYIEGYM